MRWIEETFSLIEKDGFPPRFNSAIPEMSVTLKRERRFVNSIELSATLSQNQHLYSYSLLARSKA